MKKIALIFLMIFILAGCTKNVELSISPEQLAEVTIRKNSEPWIVSQSSDNEYIKTLVEALKTGKSTAKESVNDSPSGENIIFLEMKKSKSDEHGEYMYLYLYQYDGKYYMEQPYNAIWSIDKEVYENVEKYIAENHRIEKMVKVEDRLYYSTGERVLNGVVCEPVPVKIETSVSENEIPTENNQSNFGAGMQYTLAGAELLQVLVDDEWIVFHAVPKE